MTPEPTIQELQQTIDQLHKRIDDLADQVHQGFRKIEAFHKIEDKTLEEIRGFEEEDQHHRLYGTKGAELKKKEGHVAITARLVAAMKADRELTPTMKEIPQYLVDCYDHEKDEFLPRTRTEILKACGPGNTALTSYLEVLERQGFILKEPKSQGSPNFVYRFNPRLKAPERA